MIVGTIIEKTLADLRKQLSSVPASVDVIELRLDGLTQFDLLHDKDTLKHIIKHSPKPIILTLRPASQGGHFLEDENQRLTLLAQWATLEPAYLDIESCVSPDFITQLKLKHPSLHIIRSHHNLEHTPNDLDACLSSMRHPQVSIYKIVTYADNTLDNLTLLHFLKKWTPTTQLAAHCMGPLGLPSRLIGAIMGSYFQYGMVSMPSSYPHHAIPHLSELLNTYRLPHLNASTQVFALLGYPVTHSQGALFHNQVFSQKHINALYVKIALRDHELEGFLNHIAGLPFQGLSITRPLKEKIMPYLSTQDLHCQAIGACNTVLIKGRKLHGINTDGPGALEALQAQWTTPIQKSHVLLIGSGGAAKAIAYQCALEKPQSISILNRTLENALSLAQKVGGTGYDMTHFQSIAQDSHFDIIINTIPVDDDNASLLFKLIQPHISSRSVWMSIDYTDKSSLLSDQIQSIGATLVDGYSMFTHQAVRQLQYWGFAI